MSERGLSLPRSQIIRQANDGASITTRLKKLAIVAPLLVGSGGVSSFARFLKGVALKSGKFELLLVSLSMSRDDPCSLNLLDPGSWRRGVTVSEGEWEGLPFVHVGAWAGEIEFQRYRPRAQLEQALADCDIIQLVCGYPAWANAVAGLGKPVALQVATRAIVERQSREAENRGPSAWFGIAMTRITNKLDDRALRLVDCIQVENQWMMDYAAKLNTDRAVDLRYAPPGVDTAKFRPPSSRDLDRDPYVLCVGRLGDPRKNILLLLEAYALLPQATGSKVKLLLAGFSPPPDSFWRRAESLGLSDRVCYFASSGEDELIELYRHASVFVLSSNEEGLGIVLLEAMACGVPVVSTACGGPNEIVSDGVDGYLVPARDARSMAARVNQLLLDQQLNRQMGECARQKVKQSFDQKITGKVFLDMWERMV